MSDEDFLWGVIWRGLLLIAAIAFAVWWVRAEYADCMAEKGDRIACTTYINSFL